MVDAFDEELAQALTSGREVPDELLERLSGLDPAGLQRFHTIWGTLGGERRAWLLTRLGEIGARNLALDFQPIYIDALSDRDSAVRERALELAAEDADPALLDHYLRCAIADPDEGVRLSAVEALGNFALAAQADDWPEHLQEKIELALLGILKLPGADPELRQAALLSVAFLTTDAVEQEIRAWYTDRALRPTAIAAMGRNCQPLWIPMLAEALEDEDPAIRELAAAAAGELEDPTLASHLVRRLDDEDVDVRLAAVAALGAIGGPIAREALSDLLAAQDRDLRRAAREALERLLADEDPLSV